MRIKVTPSTANEWERLVGELVVLRWDSGSIEGELVGYEEEGGSRWAFVEALGVEWSFDLADIVETILVTGSEKQEVTA